MPRGLETFDAFDWCSLLKGRDVLICDLDASRATATADAVEAAGARATIARGQTEGRDRAMRRRFSLAIIVLDADAELDDCLLSQIAISGAGVVAMVEPSRCSTFRHKLNVRAGPEPLVLTGAAVEASRVEVVGLDIEDRDLVLRLAGSADE